jgi:hypothetical protein
MSQPDPRHVPNPEVNQRLWQAWIHKNRELDKAAAKNRMRFFKVLLVAAFVAAVSQQFIK